MKIFKKTRNAYRMLAFCMTLAVGIPAMAQDLSKNNAPDVITNSIGMELKKIPAGKFMMGEEGGWDNRAHQVTLTKAYYLGVYEVTQKQYEQVMKTIPIELLKVTNPSDFEGDQNPVEYVSWKDAFEFCRTLSELPEEKKAGRVYRLPTEAEWEYACRAGTTTKYSFGDDDSQLNQHGWSDGNSGATTHPVGQKAPNPWGLYDMHGNVWEWCQDWYADVWLEPETDPVRVEREPFYTRTLRGGSWNDNPSDCSSAKRGQRPPSYTKENIGFRVALSLSGQ